MNSTANLEQFFAWLQTEHWTDDPPTVACAEGATWYAFDRRPHRLTFGIFPETVEVHLYKDVQEELAVKQLALLKIPLQESNLIDQMIAFCKLWHAMKSCEETIKKTTTRNAERPTRDQSPKRSANSANDKPVVQTDSNEKQSYMCTAYDCFKAIDDVVSHCAKDGCNRPVCIDCWHMGDLYCEEHR